MESTVNHLEAMFEKAESDLNYLSRKIDFDFSSEAGGDMQPVNPGHLLDQLSQIKQEFGNLMKEAETIRRTQQEAVSYFQTQLLSAFEMLQKLQERSGQQSTEKPAEMIQVEQILGVKFPESSSERGPSEEGNSASGGDNSHAAAQASGSVDNSHIHGTNVISDEVFQLSPAALRAQSNEFICITQDELDSVSELIRGRLKLADLNRAYERLWLHFKEERNSDALSTQDMYKMGLKVSGATGDAKLKVLRALKLAVLSKNGDVRLT